MLIIFRKEFPKHSRLRDQDVRGCGFSWSRLQLAQRYLEEGGREGGRERGREGGCLYLGVSVCIVSGGAPPNWDSVYFLRITCQHKESD